MVCVSAGFMISKSDNEYDMMKLGTDIHEYLEFRKKEENKIVYKSKAKPKEHNNNLKFNKSLGVWEEE